MSMDDAFPLPIGAYVAEGLLGAGGMGVVYRGRAPDGSAVAIKVLREGMTSSSSETRFLAEAALRIEHPNVVLVIDHGVANGRPFMVQELLMGEPLDACLEREPLGWRRAVDLGIQACRGLEEVHRRGIVHRDLKPENLFLQSSGGVKLLDFGIARWTTRETRMTTAGSVVGTPAYLSPEQAQGRLEIDERSDLWSLGAVLYEALTGVSPYERATVPGCLVAVLFEEPPRADEIDPGVPSALADIVSRCLAKDVDARWETATALRLELEPLLGAVSFAPPPPAPASASIPPGGQRIVAVLLAEGVVDRNAIAEAVASQKGAFSPLMGERAVGVFGADHWDGDELARAAAAALRCRHGAGRVAVAGGWARGSENWLSGIAMERAEAGCAARLHGVAIDSESAALLADRFRLRDRGDGHLEVVAERHDSELAGAHQMSTFGRELELEQLRLAVKLVSEQRRAALALITGPPGAGKTQVLREVTALLRTSGTPGAILASRGRPLLRDAELGLLRGALRRRATALQSETKGPRISLDAPPEERRQAVFELAIEAIKNEDLAHVCADFLGELMGVSMPEGRALRAARSDAQLMADRLRLALHDLIAGLLEQGAVALVFEDLHFADDASLEFLSELLRRHAKAPLLVLATSRPELEQRHPSLLTRRVHLTHIRLGGLGRYAVGELANSIAGRSLPSSLIECLADQTAGNPLFVSHIVATLRDDDQLDAVPESLPLPLSVEAAVQSRLDHLRKEEKDLCLRAAVMGRPFRAEHLGAVGATKTDALLRSLEDQEILVASSGRRPRFRFSSEVVREVAYEMLNETLRLELHGRVAEQLEHIVALAEGGSATRSGLDPEEIARHFDLAGRSSDAARWYVAAAQEASTRGDSATVLRTARHALHIGVERGQSFELHLACADALRFAGRRAEQGDELEAAAALAVDHSAHCRVLVEQVAWLHRVGRAAEAEAIGLDAIGFADRAGDPELGALSRGRRAEALIGLGRHDEAEEQLTDAAKLIGESAPHLAGMLAGWQARLAVARGDVAAARAAYENAARLLGGAGDLRRAAAAQVNAADAHNRVGDHETALVALEQALVAVRRVGHRPSEAYALLNVGYARTRLRDVTGALGALEMARVLGEEQNDARVLLFASIYRARALLFRDVGLASEVALNAAAVAKKSGQTAARALALVVAARAVMEAGDPDHALSLASEADELRERLSGLEEGEAELFVVHARALLAVGSAREALRVRARGRKRIQSLADRIVDPQWRARFLQDVPEHRALMRVGGEDTATIPD